MSVFNRLRYFFHRRWTTYENHQTKRRSCAPPRTTRGDGALEGVHGQSEEPRCPQNGPLATQANLGLLTKGEMNEAAQAMDTFSTRKQETKGQTEIQDKATSKGARDRKERQEKTTMPFLQECVELSLMYARTYVIQERPALLVRSE